MSERNNFRVAVGGYHKRDVMTYIEQLTSNAKASEQRYQSLLSSVRRENTRLVSRISELENRLGDLEQRLADEKQRADTLELQAGSLMSDLSRCKAAFEQNRQRARRLSRAFESSAHENQALYESLMHAEQENDRLEQLRMRLMSILLEADADGHPSQLTVWKAARRDNDTYDPGAPHERNDLDEMNENLDNLGESIANRLADIDGFIHGAAKTAHTPSLDSEAHATEYDTPPAADPSAGGIDQARKDTVQSGCEDAYAPDMPDGALHLPHPDTRSGSPGTTDHHEQRRHAPPMVEKRWERLGFSMSSKDDEDHYADEDSAS
ncbi:MAG: hypothetical protein ACERKO_11630, partial [Acetanaerobacterium sp.]